MQYTHTLQTKRQEFHSITARVRDAIEKSGIREGLCVVYCPHTTAAITINENADPDVVHDLLLALDKTFPTLPEFRHSEGNSAAHLKASCLGSSVTIPVADGRLLLGTWQGIYFCEFDGPRNRTFHITVR